MVLWRGAEFRAYKEQTTNIHILQIQMSEPVTAEMDVHNTLNTICQVRSWLPEWTFQIRISSRGARHQPEYKAKVTLNMSGHPDSIYFGDSWRTTGDWKPRKKLAKHSAALRVLSGLSETAPLLVSHARSTRSRETGDTHRSRRQSP